MRMKGLIFALWSRMVRLPWLVRRLLVAGSDLAICCVAVFVAFWLRIGEWHPLSFPSLIFLALASLTWLGVAMLSGTYLLVVRFSGRHTVFHLIPVFVI